MDEDQIPAQIVPSRRRKTMGDYLHSLKDLFFTRKGLLGDYDYGFLFRPNLPFMKAPRLSSPFFGLNDSMPVALALLLGFQHSLSMLAGIISPPLIMAGAGGANLTQSQEQYLVSTALIVSGILSMIQITRFHIYKTPYFLGTGLISVVGISFAIIPVASGAFKQMYANGFCPTAEDGTLLPCPDGYGALLGTAAVCALLEILISFIPPRTMLKIFPPIVTGPTVMLIGISLIQSAFEDWAGGLGFSVFIAIILCERFGAPIMKSTSVVIGLLVGCIIAGACGYFDKSTIDAAPAASFIWVHTFKLRVYAPLVLPMLSVFVICACEAIGDVTASCDVSRLEVSGPIYESRIQGGVLADGCNGVLAALMTITPMTTFAQNNGVIALTRCANRKAGYCCCIFLIIMGVFSKFAAALVAIQSPVLGGMTTFLFCSVAVSGIAIITRGVPFNRRNRFILTAGLALGYGATLVPTYFSYVFTYKGSNKSLSSFLDAIVLVMETGFAVTAAVCCMLNLSLPAEIDNIDESEIPADFPEPDEAPPTRGELARKEETDRVGAGSDVTAPRTFLEK
ncbi:purine permease [Grosmannia clavigera kw1407]|uniref:Purine permease n=1 Tax=Grosmannia clavigera (strain kw1407 / UAMH 11150) TaxID=655863 RepID=F0X9V6_GROCL|nr:purine permease [Grosmannia clavigera kw1407]EFX05242.1 purine permease [Grosmannia clavigera kw1407]